MLYAPHWAWSLMAVVLIGIRAMPLRFLAPIAAVVAVGQIAALKTVCDATGTAGTWTPTF